MAAKNLPTELSIEETSELPLGVPTRPPVTSRSRRNTGRNVLGDVARLAGVSTATVSRVYNAPDKVSASVRARVEAAALSLKWFPNAAGRALASARSHIAGIIIPTLDDQVFASQVSGMQATFAARDITLFVGCSNYDAAQALVQVRAMLARGVEAIALVGEAHPPEVFDALQQYNVPYVLTYAYRQDSTHVCVGFDNHAAFAEITTHLLDLGHRDFGVVTQPSVDNDRVQQRLAGIRDTLGCHGLAVRPEHFFEGQGSIDFGRESVRRMWESKYSDRPTAVICGNDALAFGVLREAQALDIAVPGTLSVTGFDDHSLARAAHPAITTMSVDTHKIGAMAACYLLDRLEGRSAAQGHLLQAVLHVRESTGRASVMP
jgi:LacI family transcriptional regulator